MASKVKTTASDLDLKASGAVEVLFTAALDADHLGAAVLTLPLSLERLTVQKVLGRSVGSTRVFEVLDGPTKQRLALKVFRRDAMSALTLHQVLRGSRVNAACSGHPSILTLYGAFQDDVNLYLVMELGRKGDLFNYLEAKGRGLTPGQACKYVIKPLLEALAFMHSRGFVHRDIKPENLLMAEDSTVLLCDFDLATDISLGPPCTQVGTPDYQAPEVLRCPHKRSPNDPAPKGLAYTAAVDCWAVGILAFEVLTGKPPFTASTRDDIKRNVATLKLTLPAWPPKCRAFVGQCLERSARNRPSAAKLLEHAWICDPNG